LAIIKRSDADMTPPSGSAEGSIAVEEAPATPEVREAPATPEAESVPAQPTPAPAESMQTMAEALPSALEPELRRIIDTAVARVAAIELDAIREARELTQRSEEEAREALRFALDRAFNLINTLELLAATVGGMAEALKVELDDAIDALRNVPQPESELAKELARSAPAEQPAPEPASEPEPEPQAATPEPEPQAATPEPEAATPAPEPEPQPVAQVEEPVTEQPVVEERREEQPVAEETPAEVAHRSNGYPAAERQAQSLAAAAAEDAEPEPEPEPEQEAAAVTAAADADADAKPTVPARRRGLMRRLFSK
jgi:outer membrane biosynthesis protein TonB